MFAFFIGQFPLFGVAFARRVAGFAGQRCEKGSSL